MGDAERTLMSRLIFIFAIVAVVYWLLSAYRKRPAKPDELAPSEQMVQCAHCGVHLPKSESLCVDEVHFCSDAHKRAHAELRK